jgi:ATP-dependent helicase Lhr and Lhr-like helicase
MISSPRRDWSAGSKRGIEVLKQTEFGDGRSNKWGQYKWGQYIFNCDLGFNAHTASPIKYILSPFILSPFMAVTTLPAPLQNWFAAKGWQPRRYQLEMLAAAQAGEHALLVAPTGAGKTLAGFLATLADLIRNPSDGLHTLYISPLKALAVDVQRNLLTPVAEMDLDIRIETRTGDTPSDRKARQRARPPQILLTTPESLSLLLSYPDSLHMFAGLKTVIVDEVHAFASGKRGDLLSLSLSRLQALAPEMRRVALSATVAEPEDYLRWLAPLPNPLPQGERGSGVTLVRGDPGAPPDIAILLPEDRVPWSGHSGKYAVAQVMAEIETHKTTLIFSNTRGLAELIFQELWSANDLKLPIAIHHGSLDIAARRKVEAAMADGRIRGLVATSSLDLGVDWAGVDCVIQMGAPKGASRLLQRIGRANHRLDEASEAILVPGNRFEYLEAQAALDAIKEGKLDGEAFRPGGIDVLAQHIMACACAAPFDEAALLAEVQSAAPYADVDADTFARILDFIATGGYALRAYDKFRRLVKSPDGTWRVTHPKFIAQHRMNAGIIVDAPMLDVRFKNGRRLGRLDEGFAATLTPGDTFFFSGLSLEVIQTDATDLYVRASAKRARIPSYSGARMPLTTHLAERVRSFLHDRSQWHRFPADVREWLEMQGRRSILPAPDQLLVETFARDGLHYLVTYSFEGWNAHQSLAMLLTKRMEARGMKPVGFVSSDYAFAIWSLDPVTDPHTLFSADILADEFVAWVENSALLKRAFREVAIIGGLVERQHPGKKKTGRQVTFSTDLIYDVLRRYQPDHLLLDAAWADARARMTDVGRLGALLDRASGTMIHKHLSHVSPLAVPVLILIGREHIAGGEAEDTLLIEAESLAAEAMNGF